MEFICVFSCQNSKITSGSLCNNIIFSIAIEDNIDDEINENDPSLLNLKTAIESCNQESEVYNLYKF